MNIIQSTTFLKESSQRLSEMLAKVDDDSIEDIRRYTLIVQADIKNFRAASAAIKKSQKQIPGQEVMFNDFNLEPKESNDT